jgi:hypothetical protein
LIDNDVVYGDIRLGSVQVSIGGVASAESVTVAVRIHCDVKVVLARFEVLHLAGTRSAAQRDCTLCYPISGDRGIAAGLADYVVADSSVKKTLRVSRYVDSKAPRGWGRGIRTWRNIASEKNEQNQSEQERLKRYRLPGISRNACHYIALYPKVRSITIQYPSHNQTIEVILITQNSHRQGERVSWT